MTEEKLIEFLSGIKIDTKIPSIDRRKHYIFSGLKPYTGRGQFKHLTGKQVIILRSPERTRPIFRLFLEPIVHIINSKYKNVGWGKHPILGIEEFENNRRIYPNLFEFMNQYNAFCLFLKNKRFT